MSDQGGVFDARRHLEQAASAYSEPADIPRRIETAIGRRQRGRRVRRIAVGAVVVVVTVAAVVVPGELRQKETVLSALSGVFSSSTVQFTVTAGGPQAPAAGALVVTITNPDGGPVQQAAGSADVELSVLRRGVDQADLIVAGDVVYARLNVPAIAPARSWFSDLLAPLALVAEQSTGYGYLTDLDAGAWIAVTEASIDGYVASKGANPPAASKVGDLRSSFATSVGEEWDTWSSIHEVASSGASTEYGLRVPARQALGGLLKDLTSALDEAFPEGADVVPDLTSDIEGVGPDTDLDLRMWVRGGAMTQLVFPDPAGGVTLYVAVSHPDGGVVVPQPAATVPMQYVAGLEDLLGLGAGPASSCHEVETGPGSLACDQAPLECLRALASDQPCSTGLPARTALTEFDLQYAELVVDSLASAGDLPAGDDPQQVADILQSRSNEGYLGIRGLSYTGGASGISGPLSVSIGPGYLVLAAFDDEATATSQGTCIGILQVTQPQETPVLGISASIGSYYFDAYGMKDNCDASGLTSVSAESDKGFPAARP